MPRQAVVYRILIASPSDTVEERKVIPEVMHLWNASNSLRRDVEIEPVLWETHASPEMGDRPQAIINKQLVEKCDILIGTFRTRLGTHTGKAESGTVEEIEEFQKAGKPVLLYFSSAPVVPDRVDAEQHKKLQDFKEKCRGEGIVFDYKSIGELREQLQGHITLTIDSLQTKVRYGKLKVRIDNNYKVTDIERDDKSPSWIEKYQQGNGGKSPPIPKWMYQMLNIRDEKGYRSLHQSKEDLLVSNKLEVIPVSGQQWQTMTAHQRNELLELVEFTGKDTEDYVRSFEIMYPRTPNFSKRK